MVDLVEALYDYNAQSPDDMTFRKGQRIEVLEHLSESWARGKNLSTGETGVLPKNYVRLVSPNESQKPFDRPAVPLPPQNPGSASHTESDDKGSGIVDPKPFDEKQQYQPPPANWQSQSYQQPPQYQPPQYPPPQQQYQQPQQYQPPQYPPQQQFQPYQPPQPTQNPVEFFMPPQQNQQQSQQQQQQPQPQQQQPEHHSKFGDYARRFGDSVMFGAGSTLGADIINKIF